tara:strand:- start:16 stop:669 length:654 start_codon:yes stop_codon:yes gene_type:complete
MYYPQSQIKTNLYTNGDEYVLSTTKENYKGYFYETSKGNKYTGKNPILPPNVLLIKLTSNSSLVDESPSTNPNQITLDDEHILPEEIQTNNRVASKSYYTITNNTYNTRFIPSPIQPQPTSKDYELDKFTRYFAKKNNELRYLEIDKQTHKSLTSSDIKIAWDLYSSITVIWSLTGEQDKVFLTNKNIVSLAERDNKWYGFTQWFRDNFLKYYLAPK